MYFKGLNGEAIVGCDEDDARRAVLGQRFHHAKAIEFGHLDIEKQHGGLMRFHLLNGFEAIRSFRKHFHVRFLFEQATEPAAGERFVIGDYGADHGHGFTGMERRAESPPSGGVTNSSLCPSP